MVNIAINMTECVDADSTEINISDGALKDTVLEKEEATLDKENKASVETGIKQIKKENEGKDEDKLNEEKAKKNIHTSKYRDYCDQELSTDLDAYVVKLMSNIIRFQDKAFVKDPVRAKMRKRYSVGLRETIKYLKEKYNLMLDLQKQLKESYAARLQIEIQSLQTKKLRYVPGMDFVPGRPASSLKYSPGVEFVPKSELNYQVVDASKKKKKNGGKQNNQNQNFHNQRDRYGWKGWQSSGQFGISDPMNAFYAQQPYHGYEFYNSENMWNPNQYMYESYNKDPIETTTYNANLTSNAIPTPTTQTQISCPHQEQQSSTATGFINSNGLADWNKLLQILKE